MKKYLPKAQKGRIIKGVAQAAKKVKVPKPKLPTRTITKGRKKFYDTDAYAKEGLKQAMTKRNVISSGDINKVKKLLKNPNITNQDALDMFKAALENNPTMKLHKKQHGGSPTSNTSRRKEYRKQRTQQRRPQQIMSRRAGQGSISTYTPPKTAGTPFPSSLSTPTASRVPVRSEPVRSKPDINRRKERVGKRELSAYNKKMDYRKSTNNPNMKKIARNDKRFRKRQDASIDAGVNVDYNSGKVSYKKGGVIRGKNLRRSRKH